MAGAKRVQLCRRHNHHHKRSFFRISIGRKPSYGLDDIHRHPSSRAPFRRASIESRRRPTPYLNRHATGIAAAHSPAITQNPPAPSHAYSGPHPNVSSAVATPTATVP
jgi:hypothetical protein